VVGAFSFRGVRGEKHRAARGDLLVAFTDGIVEPENEYGEPFGEERLVDLLAGTGSANQRRSSRAYGNGRAVDRLIGAVRRHDAAAGARRVIPMKVLNSGHRCAKWTGARSRRVFGRRVDGERGRSVTEFLAERFAPLDAQRILIFCAREITAATHGGGAPAVHRAPAPVAPRVLVGSPRTNEGGSGGELPQKLMASGCPCCARRPRRWPE